MNSLGPSLPRKSLSCATFSFVCFSFNLDIKYVKDQLWSLPHHLSGCLVCMHPMNLLGPKQVCWNPSKNDPAQESCEILLQTHACTLLSEHRALVLPLSMAFNCSFKIKGEIRQRIKEKKKRKTFYPCFWSDCWWISKEQIVGSPKAKKMGWRHSPDKNKNRNLCVLICVHICQ